MQDLGTLTSGGGGGGGGGRGSRMFGGGGLERIRVRPYPYPHLPQKCPRCDSLNTKFCYYNNYNLSQPRHYCKSCRRYWTKGGVLRNVPVGGGCRKAKRSKTNDNNVKKISSSNESTSESSSLTATTNTPPPTATIPDQNVLDFNFPAEISPFCLNTEFLLHHPHKQELKMHECFGTLQNDLSFQGFSDQNNTNATGLYNSCPTIGDQGYYWSQSHWNDYL
ncbi:hypothetical protein GIB67_038646 [Kingdonia uniflora]|uniref:Dof zinc finger protein n=1 Tax=Kingdonia uniflora TaxID=39325 RepID=A0A7J7NPP6_9MAGN|nr:hypothetical protein GIB67_038646 [Kingdonia uniflora]